MADMNLYFFKKINQKNKKFCQDQKLQLNFSKVTMNRIDPMKIGFSRIKNNAYIRKNQYLYFDGPLKVKISHEKSKLIINAEYAENFKAQMKEFISHRIFKDKIDFLPSIRKIDYFLLIQKLILFPIFWFLEKKNNIFLLHGSAVEYRGKGIIIAGLTTVGKSIGALSLTLDKNAKFLSDNFLLFDNKYVYPFPELIRISDDGKKLISNYSYLGKSILYRYNRNYYQLNDQFISGRISPSLLFIPRQSNKGNIKKLSSDVSLDRLLLANEHVKEFHNYDLFGLLDYSIETEHSIYKNRIKTLEMLLSNLDCYDLGVCYSKKPADFFEGVIDSVL